MTHLRRYDIASIKCFISIFHIDNVSQQRLYVQPFSTPMRCDNRHAVNPRTEPVLGGRRERLQGGPGQPTAAHLVSARVSPRITVAGAERSLLFRPIQKIRLAAADQYSHQKSCHTGEGGCNPITNLASSFSISVIPAKAGTQGFQSLAPGSPLSRGRRVELSAGFPDSLEGRCPWQNWVPAFPTELVRGLKAHGKTRKKASH